VQGRRASIAEVDRFAALGVADQQLPVFPSRKRSDAADEFTLEEIPRRKRTASFADVLPTDSGHESAQPVSMLPALDEEEASPRNTITEDLLANTGFARQRSSAAGSSMLDIKGYAHDRRMSGFTASSSSCANEDDPEPQPSIGNGFLRQRSYTGGESMLDGNCDRWSEHDSNLPVVYEPAEDNIEQEDIRCRKRSMAGGASMMNLPDLLCDGDDSDDDDLDHLPGDHESSPSCAVGAGSEQREQQSAEAAPPQQCAGEAQPQQEVQEVEPLQLEQPQPQQRLSGGPSSGALSALISCNSSPRHQPLQPQLQPDVSGVDPLPDVALGLDDAGEEPSPMDDPSQGFARMRSVAGGASMMNMAMLRTDSGFGSETSGVSEIATM